MGTMLHVALWALAAAAAYLLLVLLSARAEVSGLPRERTFFCTKHGPVPMSETIRLFPPPMDEPTCARCFHEAMSKAEKLK